jgi:uncharacterized repeat protein (TIGR03803 family)
MCSAEKLSMKKVGIVRWLNALCLVVVVCFAAALPARAQTYTILHSFAGAPDDVTEPNGDLIQDAAGNLYGTSWRGGTHDLGVVFKLDTSGTVTILHNFTGADGSHPKGGLFQDPTGNLYGTTTAVGSNGLGTVFGLDTNNVITTLHSFKGGSDGAQPFSTLVSVNGELYGVTQSGGITATSCPCGTIFKVSKGGKETVVHRFALDAEGESPQSLIRDAAGDLYGVASYTTQAFGGSGTVFKLDTAGVFTVLYAFSNLGEDIHPVGRLIRDTNGNIHGVTLDCGLAHCAGTVYRLDASGQEEVMHSFLRGDNGYLPLAGVIDAGGTLYGTTHFGGNGLGVVFRINQTGQYDAVHRFAGATAGDGEDAEFGGLTLGSDGSIYGTTRHGGTGICTNGSFPGCGVIFKYTP